jgi:hypothetical protein
MEWLADFAAWVWDRHHNILSWYIRPLFLLPFCWFAYRRSPIGIALTLLALVTSMAWFPAPANPDPAVVAMLDTEKAYLLGTWTPAKVAVALLVPLTFAGLGTALWRRSIGWGLVVLNGAVLFKIAWTYAVGDADGAGAHLVPALVGLVLVDAVVLGAAHVIRRRKESLT